jgi:hypothetical protein
MFSSRSDLEALILGRNKNDPVYMSDESGKIVARASMGLRKPRVADLHELSAVVRGGGSVLLGLVLCAAAMAGKEKVKLCALYCRGNLAATCLYDKFGFQLSGVDCGAEMDLRIFGSTIQEQCHNIVNVVAGLSGGFRSAPICGVKENPALFEAVEFFAQVLNFIYEDLPTVVQSALPAAIRACVQVNSSGGYGAARLGGTTRKRRQRSRSKKHRRKTRYLRLRRKK